jgi:hypothetical protein
LLAAAQVAVLALLHYREQTISVHRELEAILPAKSCAAAVNKTYWKIVAYQHAEGHPPGRLDDLVPNYLEGVPVDPASGKRLSYSTDGTRFQVSCSELAAAKR